LHTEHQLPWLSRNARIVISPGVVVVFVFLTDNNTTQTKVVLSCFVLLVGFWQQQQHCDFLSCSSQLEIMASFEPALAEFGDGVRLGLRLTKMTVH
jgi:hypothetical protein